MKEVSIIAKSIQRNSFTYYILKSESRSLSFFDSAFSNISLIIILSCIVLKSVILKCFQLLEIKTIPGYKDAYNIQISTFSNFSL